MVNDLLSRRQRLGILDRLFEYAQRTCERESGDSEGYRLVFPYCSIRIVAGDSKEVRFLVYSEPHFTPVQSLSDLGKGEQDFTFFGLRHYYLGTEDGLSEVCMRGVDELNGKLLFPGESVKFLREDKKLKDADRKIYDVLLKHARESIPKSK